MMEDIKFKEREKIGIIRGGLDIETERGIDVRSGGGGCSRNESEQRSRKRTRTSTRRTLFTFLTLRLRTVCSLDRSKDDVNICTFLHFSTTYPSPVPDKLQTRQAGFVRGI